MNAVVETTPGAIAVQPTQFSGPMANAVAALQAGMTIEQMQGLMGLQKDWEANEARKAYAVDMAEFKRNVPVIMKTKGVAHSGMAYTHATLGGVVEAISPALALHGFSHNWEIKQDQGLITVTCKLTHRLGHFELTPFTAAPDSSGKKNPIQQVASSITYMQRYTLLAACGVATVDMPDDDGQGSNGAPIDYDQKSVVETWCSRADAAINLESLRVTRTSAAEEFQKAGDVIGWNAVKAHCANCKSKLEQGAQA